MGNNSKNTNSGNGTQFGDINNPQQVIINNNNYGAFSKLSLIFKSKAAKISVAVVIALALTVGAKIVFFSKHMNSEEFYKFLLVYFQSINERNTDAHDYFTNEISNFYLEKNISPDRVNRIREKSDYTDNRFDIDKKSIVLVRTVDGVDYWRFKSGYICFRPSKKKYAKCRVEMEFGINADGKISSILQNGISDYSESIERPEW